MMVSIVGPHGPLKAQDLACVRWVQCCVLWHELQGVNELLS